MLIYRKRDGSPITAGDMNQLASSVRRRVGENYQNKAHWDTARPPQLSFEKVGAGEHGDYAVVSGFNRNFRRVAQNDDLGASNHGAVVDLGYEFVEYDAFLKALRSSQDKPRSPTIQ